jgi:hypothetical protein
VYESPAATAIEEPYITPPAPPPAEPEPPPPAIRKASIVGGGFPVVMEFEEELEAPIPFTPVALTVNV